MFVSVVSLLYRNREFRCFDWTETSRRPTETVWKGAYFVIFYRKLRIFPVFSVFFRFVRFVSKQFVSVVSLLYRNREFRLNRNKLKTYPNSLKESIFGNFSENLGLFRFVTKQICLFRLFRYRFETPKQTKFFSFWFHKTNRNKRETDLVSVCLGSNRNLFLFVSRTPYSDPIAPAFPSGCPPCSRVRRSSAVSAPAAVRQPRVQILARHPTVILLSF